MMIYIVSANQLDPIVRKLLGEGARNTLDSAALAFPVQFLTAASAESIAERRDAEPEAKFIFRQPSSGQPTISGFMPAGAVSKPLASADDLEPGTLPHVTNFATFALRTRPRLKEEFTANENPKKRMRVSVFLNPIRMMADGDHRQRFSSYHDFFKWELADHLDGVAVRANVHFLYSERQKDSIFDAQDILLRMKKTQVAHLDLFGRYDELVSLVSNSSHFITDHRDYALMALGVGVNVAYLSDRYAADDPDASLFGPGFFEPYTFASATLSRRFEALAPWSKRREEILSAGSATPVTLGLSNALFRSS